MPISRDKLISLGMAWPLANILGYVTYAGTPSGNLTPEFIGQNCYDSTNKDWYTATDTSANTDWAATALPDITLAELNVLDGMLATTDEINNACDVSARIITIADATNTLSLTQATHANRILNVLDATLAITLPEATGTGDIYTVVQGIAATSSTFVTADTANAGFHGFIMGSDTDAAGNYNWVATGAEDTITYDGTATGGKIYDWVKFTDIATDAWLLEGMIKQSGASEVTPLSSAA